jgi:hypothetical protein
MEATMSDFIKKLTELNKNKEGVIQDIRRISTDGVSKTQAQNLREYAVKTDFIDEVLLYIEYQCARDKKMQKAGKELKELIQKKYKDKDIDVIRYMLGMYARLVMIKSKQGEKK